MTKKLRKVLSRYPGYFLGFGIQENIQVTKKITFSQIFVKIHIQQQKLSWIDTQNVKSGKEFANSRGIPEFQVILGRFQE